MRIDEGSTNVTVYFYIVDDVGGTAPGEPTTGLLFSDIETGGSASYMRQGAARVDLTLKTQTVAGAHDDGGFIEVDATNMPGLYRCDYPDAAFAAGIDETVCQIVIAAANNAIARPIVVEIVVPPALASALATAQADLDIITGSDGTTLATAQGNYAPAKATDVVSAGAITTLAGAVVNVDLVDTTTTNTDMLTAAAVNAEVVDVFFTDTDAEPGQGAPGATISIADKIGFLYKAWRNRSNQTSTTYQLFNDDASTVDHKATVSDDTTTAEKGEVATGP